MKLYASRFAVIALWGLWVVVAAGVDPAPADRVPGAVIDHIPASSGTYVGSPSIAVLPSGDYVASHDNFGPSTKGDTTVVFGSHDRGQTWQKLSVVQGQYWASLFTHGGALYLLGTRPGEIAIRRSNDGGRTWTEPKDAETGLLTANDHYHCAPTPMIVHAGRVWRGFERRDTRKVGGAQLLAGMISAPVDADLLKASSWTAGRFVPGERTWLDGKFLSWREGNAVVARDGCLLNIIRVDSRILPEKAAILHISEDGHDATFDPQTDFIDFPGGSKKFTIRFDAKSDLYWSLANFVPHEFERRSIPGSTRNTLALISSPDLKHWDVRRIVLQHQDSANHGFQYVDWLFDGEDLIAACRTAYDDGVGGAHNFHDANYLTFHRIARFRVNSAVPTTPPDELTLIGHGWSLARLANGQLAFSNRTYVWEDVPEPFQNWRVTQTAGGIHGELRVRSRRDATLFALASSARVKADLYGWRPVPTDKCRYTDKGKTPMTICWLAVKAGEEITLPQESWAGTLLLVPPDAKVNVEAIDQSSRQAIDAIQATVVEFGED